MSEAEAATGLPRANRMFFLSIPPNVFIAAAAGAADHCSAAAGWTRVIVEKPFGRDSASSAELSAGLAQHLKEEQIYRIGAWLAAAAAAWLGGGPPARCTSCSRPSIKLPPQNKPTIFPNPKSPNPTKTKPKL